MIYPNGPVDLAAEQLLGRVESVEVDRPDHQPVHLWATSDAIRAGSRAAIAA